MVSSPFSHAEPLFLRIMEGVEAHNDYFKLGRDCCGQLSFSAKQKCTTTLRMLALGTSVDVVGEMVRMRESTCLKTIVKFACAVVQVFVAEYLREIMCRPQKNCCLLEKQIVSRNARIN